MLPGYMIKRYNQHPRNRPHLGRSPGISCPSPAHTDLPQPGSPSEPQRGPRGSSRPGFPLTRAPLPHGLSDFALDHLQLLLWSIFQLPHPHISWAAFAPERSGGGEGGEGRKTPRFLIEKKLVNMQFPLPRKEKHIKLPSAFPPSLCGGTKQERKPRCQHLGRDGASKPPRPSPPQNSKLPPPLAAGLGMLTGGWRPDRLCSEGCGGKGQENSGSPSPQCRQRAQPPI